MNLNLILTNYDKTIQESNSKEFIVKFTDYNFNNSDNYDLSINNLIDKKNNKIYNTYILCYTKIKNNKIKFIWSWSNVKLSNKYTSEIEKIFNYGINLQYDENNIIHNNIKYYLINNNIYIDLIELDIILAVSLYILNGIYIYIEKINNYDIYYIIKKI